MKTVIFIVAILFVSVAAQTTDYCKLCKGQQTVCLRKGCPLAGACASYKQVPLTAADKANIVNLHNRLRNQVALGQTPKQPPASDMLQLVWDDELAMVAQCWANSCSYPHDTCRNVPRFVVGQNAGNIVAFSEDYILDSARYSDTIQQWFDEYKMFDAAKYLQSTIGNPKTGHYTQVVWGNTRYIGCARIYYAKDDRFSTNFFCNYGPSGNYLGEAVYKKGPAATACPARTKKSTTYAGLCN